MKSSSAKCEKRFGADSVVVDSLTKEEWAAILKQFDDASIYQTREYGEVRWGADNLSHIVVKDGAGRVVSAAQIRILKIPLLGAVMAYVTYGPMWKTRDTERSLANFQAGLRALVEEYVLSRRLFLRLRPYGFEEIDGDMKQVLDDAGFRATRGLYRNSRQTVLLDLTPSIEGLRQGLRKRWRTSLGKAEKENLEITEACDEKSFDDFTSVYLDMVAEKKFNPGTDVGEFHEIQKRLAADQKMRVTLCKKDGEVVCGQLSSSIGDTVIGLLASTGPVGRKLGASYLLQWDEVVWSKHAGKRFLDLGGINAVANPGGYTFKTALRGGVVTALGLFDMCNRKMLYNVALSLERVLFWKRWLTEKM